MWAKTYLTDDDEYHYFTAHGTQTRRAACGKRWYGNFIDPRHSVSASRQCELCASAIEEAREAYHDIYRKRTSD